MGARPGTNWTVDDLDYIGRPREERYDSWGTAEVVTEYKEGISIGKAMDGIADLGHLHRQLLQESDFHAVGRTLLKKLSPEEENQRFGFDGRTLSEDLKAILLTLDDIGLNTSILKSNIQLAQKEENPATLEWITEHWETFLDIKPEDALAKAEFSLVDCKDKGDFSCCNEEEVNTGFGFAKDFYRTVEVFRKSFFKEAAERRLVYLRNQLHDIQQCQTPQEVEQLLWSIRQTYEEDRKLLELWSPKRKQEERKQYLQVLHRRREKIETLLGEDKELDPLDFETIRRKMWFCFDRQREEKIVEEKIEHPLSKNWTRCVDAKTGKIRAEGFITDEECEKLIKNGKPDPRKVVTERIITSPSLWDIQKSREFCDLNQTRKQWNRTYDYLWEKMGETIFWRLHSMKKAQEGVELAEYIRRFQFRLNANKLGEVILEKAVKAKTHKGKDLVRLLLASCQYRLSKEVKNEIVKEIVRRRF